MMQEKESGRILQCIGGIYTVATDSGTVSCKARGVFRKRGMTPYAGDFVTVEQGVMTEILPRKNSIIRPPLANLDQLLFVTSTYKPVPNLLLLDQFMAVADQVGLTGRSSLAGTVYQCWNSRVSGLL